MQNDPVHSEARGLLERLARLRRRSTASAPKRRPCVPASSICRRGSKSRGCGWSPACTPGGCARCCSKKSLAAAETDAAESGRLASLVLTAASLLDEALHVAPVVQDLESRAWACLGEARLRAGDLCGAEEALHEGAARLAHGTGDLLVEARLLEFEATVRRQQGRTSEAAALLKQAESRYREANEHHLAARTHHKRDQVLQQADTLLRNIVFEPTS